MIPFSEWIRIDNHPTEFNFRKVQAPDQDKFFISMVDAERNSICFDMIMNTEGKWSIIKPVPEFIVKSKEALIKTIEKHCPSKPTSFLFQPV